MNDRPSSTLATGKKTLWAWAIGTFCGVGLLKPGPGTWGSVAALLLWKLFARFLQSLHLSTDPEFNFERYFLFAYSLLGVAMATLTGIFAAGRVARESGREDPGHVVIDEVAGQWLTLAVCKPDWPHALLALLLFRLFDITKPWPIRKLETLRDGWGIMLDDLAAGTLGLVTLVIVQYWW